MRPHDYEDGRSTTAEPRETEKLGTGFVGLARWFWRQLSSMRVALMLLLMLAVAAIPGSLVPQRGADPNGVAQYQQEHPELFKVLDAFPIQAFDVYSSVWFTAIYLLLFVSLIGCILPRIVHHIKALRAPVPKTPAHLRRMVGYTTQDVQNPDATAEEKTAAAQSVIAAAAALLKKQRYRTAVRTATGRNGATEVSVSAERGYLRETGNLLFHIGLVGVLVCVAVGAGQKFNAQKALVEGETMVNALIDYDSYTPGKFFSPDALEPFRMRLDDLQVDYYTPDDPNKSAIGQARDFRAKVTLFPTSGDPQTDTIRVNHPLRSAGSPIYLVQNGYAPTLTIKNAAGDVVYSESTLFIPSDLNLTSLGVVKVPAGITRNGEATQLGLRGFFYPTQTKLESGAYTSNYPDLENPLLTLDVFVGDLGINDGVPQSVYALDTAKMEPLTGRTINKESLELRIGDTVQLPDGMGTITFDAAPRYAAFEIMHDPAAPGVLASALVSAGGLIASLFVPRRRMWVKAIVTDTGLRLEYAGLARGDDPTLDAAVAEVKQKHLAQL